MNQLGRIITLSWLAEQLGGQLAGFPAEQAGDVAELPIRGVAGIDQANDWEITFIDSPAKLPQAEASRAAAIIVPLEVETAAKPIVRVKNPRLAFAEALGLFAPPTGMPLGVHPSAILGRGVRLGKEVAIGPYVVIGDGTEIADGVVIHPQCQIGEEATIGSDTLIWSQVVIGWGTQLGARCVLHSGVVIGADGFGYIWDGTQHRKVPQIGRVYVEDDVEIGANTTIDRATTGFTRIGRGTKIDNQVHIAHNVIIGENCIIAGKVGISGSARLGNRVTLAGQVGLADHVTIGDGATVLARSAVLTDLPAGSMSSGIPAYPHREYLRTEAATRKLPETLREIRELKARLAALEAALKKS